MCQPRQLSSKSLPSGVCVGGGEERGTTDKLIYKSGEHKTQELSKFTFYVFQEYLSCCCSVLDHTSDAASKFPDRGGRKEDPQVEKSGAYIIKGDPGGGSFGPEE